MADDNVKPQTLEDYVRSFSSDSSSPASTKQEEKNPLLSFVDQFSKAKEAEELEKSSNKVKDVALNLAGGVSDVVTGTVRAGLTAPDMLGVDKLNRAAEESLSKNVSPEVGQNYARLNQGDEATRRAGTNLIDDTQALVNTFINKRLTPGTATAQNVPLFNNDWEVSPEFKNDPSLVLSKIFYGGVRAIPSMVASIGVARAAMAAPVGKITVASEGAAGGNLQKLADLVWNSAAGRGAVAGSVFEGATEAGNLATQIKQQIEQTPTEELQQYPKFNDTVSRLRQLNPDVSEDALMEKAKSTLGYELGRDSIPLNFTLTSALSAPFEGVLTKMLGGEGVKSMAKAMLKGAVSEGAQEAAQSGAGQFAQNVAMSGLNPEQSLTEGVGQQAIEGGITAIGAGAGGGALSARVGRAHNAAQQQAAQDFVLSDKAPIGAVSAYFESRGNPSAISPPEKDGARNYGTFQLSDKGTLQRFLADSGFTDAPDPKTNPTEFGQWWKQQSQNEEFNVKQLDFIKKTHVDPAMKYAGQLGYDVNNRAVQEMIWSSSVQAGPGGAMKLLSETSKTLNGDVSNIENTINTFYDTKQSRVEQDFAKQSPEMRKQVASRFNDERNLVLQLAGKSGVASEATTPNTKEQLQQQQDEQAAPTQNTQQQQNQQAGSTPTVESNIIAPEQQTNQDQIGQLQQRIDFDLTPKFAEAQKNLATVRTPEALNNLRTTASELRAAQMQLTELLNAGKPETRTLGEPLPSKANWRTDQTNQRINTVIAQAQNQQRVASAQQQALQNRMQQDQVRMGINPIPTSPTVEQKTPFYSPITVQAPQQTFPTQPQGFTPSSQVEAAPAWTMPRKESGLKKAQHQVEVVRAIRNGMEVPLTVAKEYDKLPVVKKYIEQNAQKMDTVYGLTEGQTPLNQKVVEPKVIPAQSTTKLTTVQEGSALVDSKGQRLPSSPTTVASTELKTEKAKTEQTVKNKEAQSERVKNELNERPQYFRDTKTQTTPLDRKVIERDVSFAKRSMSKGAPIEIHDSAESASKSVGVPVASDAMAFYYKGKVHIVADKVESRADLSKAVIHEQLRHHGLRVALGESWRSIMDKAYSNPEVRAKIKELQKLGYSWKDKASATEEAIAWLADSGWKSSLMDRIISAIRNWIRKINPSLKFSDGEIRNLISSAAQTIVYGSQTDLITQAAAKLMPSYRVNKVVREMPARGFVYDPLKSTEQNFKDSIYNADKYAKQEIQYLKDIKDDAADMGKRAESMSNESHVVDALVNNATLRSLFGQVTTQKDHNLLNRFALTSQLAKHSPVIAKLYDRMTQRQDEYKAAFSKTTSKFVSAVETMNKKESRSFDKIMSDLDADHSGVNFFSEKEKFIEQDGKYILNPKGNYDKLTEFIKSHYPDVSKNTLNSIVSARTMLDSSFADILNFQKDFSGWNKSELETMVKDFGYLQNYTPRKWEGNHIITVKNEKGESVYKKGFDVNIGKAVDNAETKVGKLRKELAVRKAEKIIKSQVQSDPILKGMLEKGYTWDVQEVRDMTGHNLWDVPINLEAMQYAIDNALEKNKAQLKDIDAEKFKRLLQKGIADELKTKGFGKRLVNRKNVQGYERSDMTRHILEYVQGTVGYMTKGSASLDLHKILREYNTRNTPQEYEWALNYVTDSLRSQTETDKTIKKLQGFMAFVHLGANISGGLINSLQTPLIFLPQLEKHLGRVGLVDYIKSNKAYSSFTKNMLKSYLDVFKKGTPTEFNSEERIQEMLKSLPNSTEMERATNEALAKEFVQGHFDAQFTSRVVQKLEKNKLWKTWGKVVEAALIPYSASESFNRITSFITAFQGAYAGKITNARTIEKYGNTKGDTEASIKFARDVVNEAHYDMTHANVPQVFRGSNTKKWLSLSSTFMKYTQNYLTNFYNDMIYGDRKDRIAQLKTILGITAIGGIKAAPLYVILNALVASLGDNDDDLEDMIRKNTEGFFSDTLLYGMSGSMFNTDISGRLAINMPFLDAAMKGKGIKDIAWAFAGVPTATVQDIQNLTKAWDADQYGQLMENLPFVPRAVRNIMNATRVFEDGASNLEGTPIVNPATGEQLAFTPGEAMQKAAGFTPLDYSKARELEFKIQQKEKDKTSKIADFGARLADAYRYNDQEKIQKIMDQVQEYNQKQIDNDSFEMVIPMSSIRNSVRERLTGKKHTQQFRRFANEAMEYYGYSK